MGKYFAFSKGKANDECPARPRSVRVYGDAKEQGTKQHGGAALKVLAKALKEDPQLEKDHPEFLAPDDSKSKKSSPKK